MAAEFARNLKEGIEGATERLLHLSPFQTKNLLHHIMSSQEYEIEVNVDGPQCSIASLKSVITNANFAMLEDDETEDSPENDNNDSQFYYRDAKRGWWKRRRVLDGCLTRYVIILFMIFLRNVLPVEFPQIFTPRFGRCSSVVRASPCAESCSPTASPRR